MGRPEPGPEALSLGQGGGARGGDKVRAAGAWSPFRVLWVQLEMWVLVGGILMEGGGDLGLGFYNWLPLSHHGPQFPHLKNELQ